MSRLWQGLAMAIALAAMTAGGVVITQQGGVEGEANAWINTTGQTCTRSSIPITFEEAQANGWLCGTFDAAWDAMSAGDTARIMPGTYGQQCITGDKTSDTKMIGNGDGPEDVEVQYAGSDCFAVFSAASAVGVAADHFWLENVTLNSLNGLDIGAAARVWNYGECLPACNGENVTFINVYSKGYWPAFKIEADGFTWIGGSRGENGTVNDPPLCAGGGQPLDLGGDDAHIEDIQFNPVAIGEFNPVTCDPHVENIRLDGAVDNILIRNNYFVAGSDVGSGHIFNGTGGGATNVKVIGNYFGAVNGTYWFQGDIGAGMVIAYNTFTQAGTTELGAGADFFVGNLGPASAYSGCYGTHIKNVWGGSGSCGTDTFVGSTDLEIDGTGHIGATSPAIDAAETPGASDYCTDSVYANSDDRDGDVRPQGSVCDAGADERG